MLNCGAVDRILWMLWRVVSSDVVRSAYHITRHNLVYNDLFRLTRVIIRLCSETLNVLNDCAFWDPKKLTLFTLLTYNYYLKVLWLCVFNTVSIFECFPEFLYVNSVNSVN